MEQRLDLVMDQEETIQSALMRHPGLSRRQISRLKFMSGGIRLNGKPARAVDPVLAGDIVSLRLHETGDRQPVPYRILYEDDLLLVLDKPAGLVVHPAPGHEADSVQTELERCLGHPLYLKGRLDKDTSGILVFGKADWVPSLTETKKTYLAVCEGCPGDLTIDAPLGLHDRKMAPDPAGKKAVTHVRQIRQSGSGALLAVTIEQGRMHQIRAHLAMTDHPLYGDPLYGTGTADTRAMLHCATVRLVHPVSRQVLYLSACLPEDFCRALGVSSWSKR